MGWAGANPIFGSTAQKMIDLKVSPEIKTEVLAVLIRELQTGDWDTEDESLGEFKDDEAIVEAFRRNRVVIKCGSKDGSRWCERERLPRGHEDGRHEDYQGYKWPVETG